MVVAIVVVVANKYMASEEQIKNSISSLVKMSGGSISDEDRILLFMLYYFPAYLVYPVIQQNNFIPSVFNSIITFVVPTSHTHHLVTITFIPLFLSQLS